MEHVRSAALNFLVPAGCVYDPPEQLGLGAVLSDLITRGAGERDSRELTLALDNLGLDRGESVGLMHMRFWGATLARNLPAALEHLRRHPAPAAPARRRTGARSRRWPCRTCAVWRTSRGRRCWSSCASIRIPRRWATTAAAPPRASTPSPARPFAAIISDWFQPGRHDPVRGRQHRMAAAARPGRAAVRRLEGRPTTPLTCGSQPPRARRTSPRSRSRRRSPSPIRACRSAIRTTTPPWERSTSSRGGMSSRLFTEVREKRGLCYSVWASYQTLQGPGQHHLLRRHDQRTRPGDARRAACASCSRLQEGIEAEEVERVQAGLKSSLIMQQESTSARAGRWRRTGTTWAGCAASTRSRRPSTA